MKKFLIFISFVLFSVFNAQQSQLIINNYSAYDYKGVVIATGLNSCYPTVSNTYYPAPTYYPLIVVSGNTANVGLYSSGNEVLFWDVQTASTNPVTIKPYNHMSLISSNVISLNTDWQHSKFEMYYTGTNTPVPNTTVNISSGTNACYAWPSYYYNNNSGLEVEWFKIGDYSYIQIY